MTNKDVPLDAGWNFDTSYIDLPQSLYTIINPTPVGSPKLVIINESLATSLGLDAKALVSEEGVATLVGNIIPDEAIPLAQAYAGHQFGHFNRLGDGRAILLSEQITPQGERVDIQLKGSGPTPYSRRGDGRAALGPMLREYIISEAMHGLGIATTRSLAVVATGETVIRETNLPGAVLVRVAASHLRVGTFEYVSQWGDDEELKQLADYTIKRHYPYIASDDNRYLHLLEEVIKHQAHLIAQWQLVGFIHGVMNTDNMAISGETIDYGPCAFMDSYDPATVFSSIDREGRYAYGNQPYIGSWNLSRFAETLLPLLHNNHAEAVELAQTALSHYATEYFDRWLAGMRAKLGLFNEEEQDEALVKDLLGIMHKYGADYTNTFIALTFNQLEDSVLVDKEDFRQWYTNWQERVGRQPHSTEAVQQLMRNSNPAIIPRNHRVEEALDAAVRHSDYSVMVKLLEALSSPYEHSAKQAVYATLPDEECGPYRTFCGT
ncbi:protein adenylyltransferase SelO [Paenibacillus endoradicis]|uniref:protein adenylyltransferase SelO n=1 Tax=Paenibacillus endoradicis TaxID=2972487 RepID=UPI002158EDD9|nr:YdiU family protein [Paenibacillus endoradicis]MCR8658745.1 YdiU family protein [Paenibacillus endoradicis]